MYRLERITSRSLALDLTEVKVHLRVDHDTEDNYISDLIYAVQDMLEPPDGWLGRALARADYRLTLPGFSSIIKLPAPPFVELKAFKYFDVDGDEQTVDADDYRVIEKDIAYIEIVSGKAWPMLQSGRLDPVKVEYTAGYNGSANVPQAIRQYMMMQISQLYDMRSLVNAQQVRRTPYVANMLEGWRVRL